MKKMNNYSRLSGKFSTNLKYIKATANNLTKSLPNASSDSDLPRFRHKSPSISNETPEAAAARAAIKDNSQSSTTSKFLKDMQAHSKHHVGEKVAQLKILGKVALPLHQEPTWVSCLRHLSVQHF
ncbi:hypothetical protein CDAR_545711 [Caerostris darwini]|uniref:Uncharacterized protein n=1 Tax=Caerostris darwini TaxID=1538125 RepID=A0AAV4WVM2_9ARAC|nr:hypothetical protein CDAR_545711 [Caerostris darwini]